MSRSRIGWTRATASALAVVAVGFLAVVYLPNQLLTSLGGLNGSARSTIAATISVAAVVLMAWALRVLQARRVI